MINNTDLQSNYFNYAKNRFKISDISNQSSSDNLEFLYLKDKLNLKPGSTIIDFGCGNGRITINFLKLGYNVIGVDISEKSLTDLKKNYQKYKKDNWGRLSVSTHLPERIQVDGIVGSDILHHITIFEYLPIFKNLLHSGGNLVFSEPNAWHFPWYFYIFSKRLPWNIEKGIVQCSIPKLTTIFHECGYSNIQINGLGLLPCPIIPNYNKLTYLNDKIGDIGLLRYFAFRLIIHAIAT